MLQEKILKEAPRLDKKWSQSAEHYPQNST